MKTTFRTILPFVLRVFEILQHGSFFKNLWLVNNNGAAIVGPRNDICKPTPVGIFQHSIQCFRKVLRPANRARSVHRFGKGIADPFPPDTSCSILVDRHGSAGSSTTTSSNTASTSTTTSIQMRTDSLLRMYDHGVWEKCEGLCEEKEFLERTR